MDAADIQYNFYVNDQMTGQLANIQASSEQLRASTEQTGNAAQATTIKFMGELMAVMALYSGFRRLTMSLHTLGLMSDQNYQTMMKFAAAIGLVVSVFQMVKGVTMLIRSLREAEIGLALVETYRAILNNPAKLGLAIAGVAAAGVAVGALAGMAMGGGGKTTVTQNVSFGGYASPQAQRDTARTTMEYASG